MHGKPYDLLWQCAYSGQFRRTETRSKNKIEEKINTITTHTLTVHTNANVQVRVYRAGGFSIPGCWICTICLQEYVAPTWKKAKEINGILLCDHCYREWNNNWTKQCSMQVQRMTVMRRNTSQTCTHKFLPQVPSPQIGDIFFLYESVRRNISQARHWLKSSQSSVHKRKKWIINPTRNVSRPRRQVPPNHSHLPRKEVKLFCYAIILVD